MKKGFRLEIEISFTPSEWWGPRKAFHRQEATKAAGRWSLTGLWTSFWDVVTTHSKGLDPVIQNVPPQPSSYKITCTSTHQKNLKVHCTHWVHVSCTLLGTAPHPHSMVELPGLVQVSLLELGACTWSDSQSSHHHPALLCSLSEADAVRNCEKGTWQYKRLLCKIQEIPILDVVLKLSIQYQETYLELKGLVFGLSVWLL